MAKCTVQVVDLSGARPKSVRKLTLNCSGLDALNAIQEKLSGHIVSGKRPSPDPAIAAEKAHTAEVKEKEKKPTQQEAKKW